MHEIGEDFFFSYFLEHHYLPFLKQDLFRIENMVSWESLYLNLPFKASIYYLVLACSLTLKFCAYGASAALCGNGGNT
jgi:hypothetical protein